MAYWPLTHESTAQNMHLCGLLPTHNRCSRRIAAEPLVAMLNTRKSRMPLLFHRPRISICLCLGVKGFNIFAN